MTAQMPNGGGGPALTAADDADRREEPLGALRLSGALRARAARGRPRRATVLPFCSKSSSASPGRRASSSSATAEAQHLGEVERDLACWFSASVRSASRSASSASASASLGSPSAASSFARIDRHRNCVGTSSARRGLLGEPAPPPASSRCAGRYSASASCAARVARYARSPIDSSASQLSRNARSAAGASPASSSISPSDLAAVDVRERRLAEVLVQLARAVDETPGLVQRALHRLEAARAGRARSPRRRDRRPSSSSRQRADARRRPASGRSRAPRRGRRGRPRSTSPTARSGRARARPPRPTPRSGSSSRPRRTPSAARRATASGRRRPPRRPGSPRAPPRAARRHGRPGR